MSNVRKLAYEYAQSDWKITDQEEQNLRQEAKKVGHNEESAVHFAENIAGKLWWTSGQSPKWYDDQVEEIVQKAAEDGHISEAEIDEIRSTCRYKLAYSEDHIDNAVALADKYTREYKEIASIGTFGAFKEATPANVYQYTKNRSEYNAQAVVDKCTQLMMLDTELVGQELFRLLKDDRALGNAVLNELLRINPDLVADYNRDDVALGLLECIPVHEPLVELLNGYILEALREQLIGGVYTDREEAQVRRIVHALGK